MSYPWESKAIEAAVQEILDSMEVPAVDPAARRALQRLYYRKRQFGADAPGDLTLLCRTIIESHPNGPAALIEPVILAVDGVMRPEWTATGLQFLETFDHIDLMSIVGTMRGLDLFAESSLSHYLAIVLRNRLAKAFEPAKAAPVKREPAVPASIRRIPIIERNIQRGVALLELRAKHRHNTAFGRACLKEFGTGGQEASDLMRVARHYASKPEIFRKLSWAALKTLSEAMPEATRLAIEKRIIAGEKISIPKIKAARGWRKTGRPKQALRMAA